MGKHLRDTYWHLICHRSELKKTKDFLRFDWVGGEVVVFNDHGKLVAFDNLCPHRGARIFTTSSGSQATVCAYHGWSYSAGRMNAANAKSFTQCDVRKAALEEFSTDWCGDFLFVSKAPRSTLRDQLDGVWPTLESISHCVNERRDFDSYIYECDWRIALENALEPYHVPLIHRDSLGLLKLADGENQFFGVNSIWYSEVGNERMAKQLGSLRRLFNIEFQYKGYMSIFLFPFAMLSSTFGYSYSLQNFFPSSQAERTSFNSRLLAAKLADGVGTEALDSFFDSTAKVNRQVFDEDHQICKRVSVATWSAEPPKYFSESEAKLMHFRRTCKQVLEQVGGDKHA